MSARVAAPRDVTVLEKSSDTIALQWEYDDVTGVTFLVKYRPRAAAADGADNNNDDDGGDDDDAGEQWIEAVETASTKCRVTGLQPGTHYQLRVVAQNDAGQTQCSSVVSGQTEQLVTLGILHYVTMYSWLNSIVSNRRMIVIVNDRYYAAYDVVHLFLYLTS